MTQTYTTQMDAARKGIITPQMREVLANEVISEQLLLERVAQGRIAIPANKHHHNLKAAGVGQGLKTKINVNLGVSKDVCSFEGEMNKARLSLKYKADAIIGLERLRRHRRLPQATGGGSAGDDRHGADLRHHYPYWQAHRTDHGGGLV
ncbi:hypothetical protein LDFHOB_11205 [Candidatus Electronema aureum]